MEKLTGRLVNNNQMEKMSLKEVIDYFQIYFNDTASVILTAVKETICIIRKDYKTEINITLSE